MTAGCLVPVGDGWICLEPIPMVDGLSMRPSKILVADDDPSYADVVEQELLAAGHEARQAADGVESLEAVREERPDILVLDLIPISSRS